MKRALCTGLQQPKKYLHWRSKLFAILHKVLSGYFLVEVKNILHPSKNKNTCHKTCMRDLWTAYVAGSAALNLQKNDVKYEARVLQQSGFLAYGRAEKSSATVKF